MKKLFGAFALAGLVGLTACETRDDRVIIEDDPLFEQPATAPVVTEPAPPPPMPPTTTDTVMVDPAPGVTTPGTPGVTDPAAPGAAPGTTTPGTTTP